MSLSFFFFFFSLFSVLQSHTCGNPGLIPKGIIHGTRYNIGDKIRYTCVMGYVLEGHAVLTCIVSPGSGASWDFPAPFCRGKILSRTPSVWSAHLLYCMSFHVTFFWSWTVCPERLLCLVGVKADIEPDGSPKNRTIGSGPEYLKMVVCGFL